MYEFKLPDLGEGIHEGEILEWHVKVGDSVKEDDPLVDIETDKAAVTIPSPAAGVVVEAAGGPGTVVQVGQVLCRIDSAGGAAAAGEGAGGAAAGEGAGGAAAGEGAEQPPAKKPVDDAEAALGGEPEAEEPPPSTQGQPRSAAAPARPAPTAPAARTAPSPPPAAEVERRAAAGAAGRAVVGPVPAAPATRRLARELGVDLRDVPPSGPGGRVTAADVQQLAAQAKAGGRPAPQAAAATAPTPASRAEDAGEDAAEDAPAAGAAVGPGAAGIPLLEVEALPDFSKLGPVEVEPLRSIRRKTARKMVIAAALIPHVAHMDDADVTELDALRRRLRERFSDQAGGRLSLLPFVMKAVVAGLKASPTLNASIDPVKQEIIYKRFYNLGFAADTPRGLVVPVVRDVDRKSLLQVSAEVVGLATAARDGSIDAGAFQGGTFTITNIGPLGGRYFTPIINYPEVAILAMGRVEERPVVRNGAIEIRTLLPLTLSFDHRLIDGADAARFMDGLLKRLASPEQLMVEI